MQDQLTLLMIRGSLKAKYRLISVAEAHGVTLMQALALCMLDPGVAVPMNTLSTFLNCDPSNITGIVDGLVAKSYLERKESAQDRRKKEVIITTRGLALRRKLIEASLETRAPNLKNMTHTEVSELIRLLAKASAMNLPPVA